MNLSASFEDALADAVMSTVETRLAADDGPVGQAIAESQQVLETAGSELGWSVDPIIESLEGPRVERQGPRVRATWGWTHEAAPYWEFGTPPHTIEGDPILSFIWEDAPPEVREMFSDTERVNGDPRVFFREVDHPGTPALRFVREGLRWLRSRNGLRS